MKLRGELPHFRAMCRDGVAWALDMDGLPGFRSAWLAGKAFWSGVDIWNQPIDIKLADITAVIVWTEESLALGVEEDAEKKHREVITS